MYQSVVFMDRRAELIQNECPIHREVYMEAPPKVEYYLTDVGKSFI